MLVRLVNALADLEEACIAIVVLLASQLDCDLKISCNIILHRQLMKGLRTVKGAEASLDE